MIKPFSKACENNKQIILDVIKIWFHTQSKILEIGSGTGQHAVFFAEKMPAIFWQTSDRIAYHQGINQWIDSVDLINIGNPFELDVTQSDHWLYINDHQQQINKLRVDGVFSANTAHIMSWTSVIDMFRGVGRLLQENEYFLLYGPFNRDGEFTSQSNAQFHHSLVNQNKNMGIRDDAAILDLAAENSLELADDVAMPANNRILVFKRIFE